MKNQVALLVLPEGTRVTREGMGRVFKIVCPNDAAATAVAAAVLELGKTPQERWQAVADMVGVGGAVSEVE